MNRSLILSIVLLGSILAATIGCLPLPADVVQKAVANKSTTPPPPAAAAPRATSGVEVVSQVEPAASAVPTNAVRASATAAATIPAGAASSGGRLWVVVKNLKVSSGFGLESNVSADWEVVQGAPEPGASYVLRVSDGDSGGIIEHYIDFDLDLGKRAGIVQGGARGPSLGVRGGLVAVVGKTGGLGRDELDLVSGKCRVGGQSEATPPPTVAEAAGQAAQGGLLIAIANPRREGVRIGSPRSGWSVDYEVQGSIGPGERYFWIVEDSSGGAVEFDVTTDLATPFRASAKKGTFSGSPAGFGVRGGQLKMYIERRGYGFRSEATVVSNEVTLK